MVAIPAMAEEFGTIIMWMYTDFRYLNDNIMALQRAKRLCILPSCFEAELIAVATDAAATVCKVS